MQERYKVLVAVLLILTREVEGKTQVLLQRRSNTGWMDERWDLAVTGHVEKDESIKFAMIRETFEEIGIMTSFQDVVLSHIRHKRDEDGTEYMLCYFNFTNYDGNPIIKEQKKISALGWFCLEELESLPLVPGIYDAIQFFINKKYSDEAYVETGFDTQVKIDELYGRNINDKKLYLCDQDCYRIITCNKNKVFSNTLSDEDLKMSNLCECSDYSCEDK